MAFLLQRSALPQERTDLILSVWQAAQQAARAVSSRAALPSPRPEAGR